MVTKQKATTFWTFVWSLKNIVFTVQIPQKEWIKWGDIKQASLKTQRNLVPILNQISLRRCQTPLAHWFVGPLSDQMSHRSQASRVTLYVQQSKGDRVTE